MANIRNDAEVFSAGRYYTEVRGKVRRKNQRIYLLAKRGLDMTGALIGLICFLPLFVLVAIWIKWEDPKGTVFFKQQRVGRNGVPFLMYKFRSMVWNAEELLQQLLEKNEVEGAMFKLKDDPRVTKVGRFIRMTSIDELPQLWNVLRGDMSLVGPRPPLPREVEQYTNHDRQRLAVTPGCTGLWQVSGRNDLSFAEMVELDLYYIEHRSLWMDIKLIFRTVWIMVFPNSAY